MSRSPVDHLQAIAAAFADAYETVKEHGRFTDSPVERVEGLFVEMFASPTLPNVVLGAALTATIQYLTDRTTLLFLLGTWVAYWLSVVLYAVGEEVIYAYKASKRTFEDDPRGIE